MTSKDTGKPQGITRRKDSQGGLNLLTVQKIMVPKKTCILKYYPDIVLVYTQTLSLYNLQQLIRHHYNQTLLYNLQAGY